MTALYRGELVHVVRFAGRHTIIIWRGMQKRVHARDLVTTPEIARVATAAIASSSERIPQ